MGMVASIEDYSASVCLPQMVKAIELKGGHPLFKNGRLVKYAGGFCVVFPYEIGLKKYALRCWHSPVKGIEHRSKVISGSIKRSGLPYFVDFEFLPEAVMTAEGIQPAILMDWVDAIPLKQYIAEHLETPKKLDKLAETFLQMVKDLHSVSFSHGDLQHRNILVRPDGSLVLVDYDSMFVPELEGEPEEIKGLAGYQHPARASQKYMSPKSDYFSELVIYTSICTLSRHPGLWKKLMIEGSETMIFSEDDISSRGRSHIFDVLEADRNLRPLGRALKDALQQTNLGGLRPLECCIEGAEDTIVKNLAEKWHIDMIDFQEIADHIAKGWRAC